VCVCVCVWS